jgi:hypothetical protein
MVISHSTNGKETNSKENFNITPKWWRNIRDTQLRWRDQHNLQDPRWWWWWTQIHIPKLCYEKHTLILNKAQLTIINFYCSERILWSQTSLALRERSCELWRMNYKKTESYGSSYFRIYAQEWKWRKTSIIIYNKNCGNVFALYIKCLIPLVYLLKCILSVKNQQGQKHAWIIYQC